jgi:hypothetical protein
MQPLQDFLKHNFNWLFLICFAWVIVSFGYRYYRHKKTGVVFPDVPSASICFDERGVSGCSYKTIFTRLGGARNCLHVTVTDTEVWIRTFFPLSVLAQQADLEHRIPRASITSAESKQLPFARRVLLDHRDDHGQVHRFSLVLKKPDDFLRALNLHTQIV